MGVDIPQPFVSKITGPIGPVTVDGIPSTFHINVDTLPKIQLGVDPVTLNPVEATLTLTPVDVALRIERLPDVRAHLPADFTVGLAVLGLELLSVRMCGEAQLITEPYVPGPCEVVGEPERPPDLQPLPEKQG
jgi:hypothetical protein